MQLHLSIPEPCHERWDAMTPTAKGAFCKACSKEVIDFTGYSAEQLVQYFTNYAGDGVCGRLKNAQLGAYTIHVSPQLLRWKLPLWKKMLAVILICFGNLLLNAGNAQGQGSNPVQVIASGHTGIKKAQQSKQKKKKRKKGRTTAWLCEQELKDGFIYVTLGFTIPERKELPAYPDFPILQSQAGAGVTAGNGDSMQSATAIPGNPLPPGEAPLPEKQTALVAGTAWMRLRRNIRQRKNSNN